MNNGSRVLLASNTITANVGDTFTLSLNGINAGAIPDSSDESTYGTAYDVSDYLHRGAPTYDKGNTFVTFTCRKTGSTTLSVYGQTLNLNIANNSLYMYEGDTRKPINEAISNNTIYACVGEKFTLSVNDTASHLLAPKSLANEEINIAYDMGGGYLNRGATVYSNTTLNDTMINITNVEFTCLQEGTTILRVNNRDITVVIKPVYMVMNDGRRLLLGEAMTELNKTTDKIVYLVEGESVTLSVDGENQNGQFIIGDSSIVSGTAVNDGGNTNVTFTALKHGETTVTAHGQRIAFKVSHPMYVKENNQERDIDRINEWVSSSAWMNKKNGYAPNSEYNYPYQVYDNDTLILRIPAADLSNAHLVLDYTYNTYVLKSNPDNHLELSGPEAILTMESGSLTEDHDEIMVVFRAHNTTDFDLSVSVNLVGDDNKKIRTMYVRVPNSNRELLDHADIEIADGGKYTITKLIRETDGTVRKEVTEYRAYVAGVNSSTLYQNAEQPCQFYYTADYFVDSSGQTYTSTTKRTVDGVDKWFADNGTDEVEVEAKSVATLYDDSGKMTLTQRSESTNNGVTAATYTPYQEDVRTGITGYLTEDYWVDPRIPKGSTQYEFTSKYKMDENGNFTHWSNIKYYPSTVDHVVFDVKLGLEPSQVSEYTKDSNGVWILQSSAPITNGETKELPSVKFTMNHQDVLDAYNKCPNHTGLDFTVMAFSALVEFDVNKELSGGTIQEDQFEFEAIRQEVKVVRKGDGYGNGIAKMSDYSALINSRVNYKNAYRAFYRDPNNVLQWGNGIDGEGVLNELHSLGMNEYIDAGSVFGAANGENRTVLNVLKKHLKEPAEITRTVLENDTQYTMNDDGLFLLVFESDPIQTVKNNANGVVTFDAMHFESPGSYNYILREKNGAASDIIYDNTLISVEIEVSEDQDTNQLTADILSDVSDYEFINIQTYRLPDTGGSGTLPWYLGGTVILAAATLLMIKKRREGS